MKLTHKYLQNLGFTPKVNRSNFGEFFLHKISITNNNFEQFVIIPFVFYKDEESLFYYYLNEWNRNEISFFIAIDDKQSHIINAKEKAKNKNLLKSNLVIDSFDYGTNTTGYENIDSLPFTKENFDNSFFFDIVLQKQKEAKNEIDTYLLNSLIALREEFTKFDNDFENLNGLILKSLFVKYLEDRNILPDINLVEVLKEADPKKLKKVFLDIAVINGDILKKNLIITTNHINELKIFFTHDYTEYKKNQLNLFYPYKFDKIPIQLISNIYEEFLGRTNKKEKKSKGIFYTRTFVIDFMLSHNVYPKIEKQPNSTVLDPSCGSGTFLVRAYNKILESQKSQNLSIDEKANILKKQIFGIDIDKNALQITAFSLYLTLLQGISKDDIRKQIEIRKPILPSLIGSNLLKRNTITDDIQFDIKINENNKINKYLFTKFDCIVSNPPWRELKISDETDVEAKKSREHIKSDILFNNVSKYQTSQAFLLKINKLSNNNTDIAIIVNNSNFLNEGAGNFRKEILEKYCLKYFYELSEVADILFKGTKHPSAVLILDKKEIKKNIIKYISPQSTKFSEKLRIISYSSKDVKEVKQEDLKQEDILWRVFVKGNWKDYQLTKKIELQKDNRVKVNFCGRGINPNKATPKDGKPIIKNIIEANQLEKFCIKKIDTININQKFERERVNKEKLFNGKRILLKRMPSAKDNLKLTTVFVENELYFKEQIIALKLNNEKLLKSFSTILNSSLIGYYFNQTSAQTNKGKKKPSIRHQELIKLPFIHLSDNVINKLNTLYDKLNLSIKNNINITGLTKQLDELVFDLYGLLEFEKEIIREFYQINVERKNDFIKETDINIYIEKFREVYQLMLKKDLRLNTSFIISKNIGTIVKFDIVSENDFEQEIKRGDLLQQHILQLVKKNQIQQELLKGYINEEKVIIYEGKSFYIIKSKLFKDWTKRQAMEDANEEVKAILKKLL